MLRQCLHGSLVLGGVAGQGFCLDARWSWMLILIGMTIALTNAVRIA